MTPDRAGLKAEFQGNDRFALERRLGAGSMGVVFAALDRSTGRRVALKTLRDPDPEALYYLKREFRALADVSHPNLVRLHELHSDGSRWFFTMELVEGVDFLSWVRGGSDRLRPAFQQLATGVRALHDAGKLHRDLKPSNALVARDGRVVILDFGLCADVGAGRRAQTFGHRVVGTPAYLAPEQADGGFPHPAGDWYAFGVMLFEALTGDLPFAGNLLEILEAKQQRDAPAPRAIVPGVPEDLDRLCVELLRRPPGERPSGRDVLGRLGGGAGVPAEPPIETARTAPHGLLVGRIEALAALHAACAATREPATPHPVLVLVRGAAGAGKTALAQRFLDEIADRTDAVVLQGRCFERELVPYRALDSLVDTLSRYLARLPGLEVEALLPRDTAALGRLFPVLRRIEAVARTPRRPASSAALDPQELRARAFAALLELIERLSDRRPVVLWIDDLQWGDVDSAHILRRLLESADPPPLLLVACFRDEDRAQSACLETLLGGEAARLGDVREIAVGPLLREDARQLALALLEREGAEAAACADAIAGDAAGSPLAVHELCHHVKAAAGPGALPARTGLDLDDVLRARIAALSPIERRLLETVAVAGRPLPADVARRVSEVAAGDPAAESALRAARLVRGRADDGIEIAHDRIRQVATADLGPGDFKARHQALAVALEAKGGVDPEVLAFHELGAGNPARAAELAAEAGARADQALGFDRAARLFQWALTLEPEGSANVLAWRIRLGDALGHMGRGAEAAEAYLAAVATGPDAALRTELRRRAAEQLIRTGHVDEGLEALGTVLDSLGVDLPATPRRALGGLLGRRALIRLRGLGFRPRDRSEIAAADLTRVDTFWSIATSLGIIDNVRATDFQTRHLLLALRLGEPGRIARALAAEAAYSGLGGSRTVARTAHLVETAQHVAERVKDPFARGWAALASGMAAYMEGRRRDAVAACASAEGTFAGCVGVTWEVSCARLFRLWSLTYLGEMAELGRLLPGWLAEAEERGDLYSATNLRTGILNHVWLCADDPQRARRELDAAMSRWSRKGFHSQHFWDAMAGPQIDLYVGDAEAAWSRVEREAGPLARSLILRIQTARIEWGGLRGRAALALAARDAAKRAGLVRAAGREAQKLDREGVAWAKPFAALLRAGIAGVREDRRAVVAELAAATAGFEAADMPFMAAVARRRWGERQGGVEGIATLRDADAFMQKQGVKDPIRMAASWTPGL